MAVTIVSPSGNPEVWGEDMVETKLAEGYRTFEVWQAEQKQIAEEKRQEWLSNPETEAERFRLLRQARDAKFSAYDTAIAQLEREKRIGVDVGALIQQWDAYAQALCNLPAQAGAPWDGGGKLTPWPAKPE